MVSQKKNSKLFHIHINADKIGEYLVNILLKNGFFADNFYDNIYYIREHTPNFHFTFKTVDSRIFKKVFLNIVREARESIGFDGYIEGEYVAQSFSVPERPFNQKINIPFVLEHTKQMDFRKSEIHIAVNKDLSNKQLLRNLKTMGFYSTHTYKPYGIGQLFSAQGTVDQIKTILHYTADYLQKAGGCKDCHIKEERTARSWVSNADYPLPPIISKIIQINVMD